MTTRTLTQLLGFSALVAAVVVLWSMSQLGPSWQRFAYGAGGTAALLFGVFALVISASSRPTDRRGSEPPPGAEPAVLASRADTTASPDGAWVGPEERDFDDLIKVSGLVEMKIGHELGLVGQRMSWLVLSQTFLLTAFSQMATKSPKESNLVVLLRFGLPVLGAFVCLLAWYSIRAARQVLNELMYTRERLESALNSDPTIRRISQMPQRQSGLLPLLGRRRPQAERAFNRDQTVRWGDLPTRYLPPVMGLVWVLLFVGALVLSSGQEILDQGATASRTTPTTATSPSSAPHAAASTAPSYSPMPPAQPPSLTAPPSPPPPAPP